MTNRRLLPVRDSMTFGVGSGAGVVCVGVVGDAGGWVGDWVAGGCAGAGGAVVAGRSSDPPPQAATTRAAARSASTWRSAERSSARGLASTAGQDSQAAPRRRRAGCLGWDLTVDRREGRGR
jgi:hypothetical protein